MLLWTLVYRYLFKSLLSVLLNILFRVAVVNHRVVANSEKPQNCSPQWLHSFTFLPAMLSFQFLHIIISICYVVCMLRCVCVCFNISNPYPPKVWHGISLFQSALPYGLRMWASFHGFVHCLYIFFGEMTIKSLTHLYIGLYIGCCYWLLDVLYIFWILFHHEV